MKKWLLFLLLSPVLTWAQGGFYSLSAGVDMPNELQHGLSARLSAGVNMNEFMWTGINMGVTKLNGIEGVVLPIGFTINAAPVKNKKVSPLFTLEPGLGIYRHDVKVGNATVEQTGGFTVYSGLGLLFSSSKSKNKSLLTFGISQYTLETEGVKKRYLGFAARAGLLTF